MLFTTGSHDNVVVYKNVGDKDPFAVLTPFPLWKSQYWHCQFYDSIHRGMLFSSLTEAVNAITNGNIKEGSHDAIPD